MLRKDFWNLVNVAYIITSTNQVDYFKKEKFLRLIDGVI